MSGLIIPGGPVPTAVRPNRKARRAHAAMTAGPKPIPNMQPRVRGLPPVKGASTALSPIGPAIVVVFDGGQNAVCPMTPAQADSFALSLIKLGGQMEMLKKMAEQGGSPDDPSPGPIPTENPDLLDELLAEAQANTAQHAERPTVGTRILKEEIDVDDDSLDLVSRPEFKRDGPIINGYPSSYVDGPPPVSQPAPNSFDINGKPVYEPPAE